MNQAEEEREAENDTRQTVICKRSNGVRDIDSTVDCDRCSYAQSLWEIYRYSWMPWKKSGEKQLYSDMCRLSRQSLLIFFELQLLGKSGQVKHGRQVQAVAGVIPFLICMGSELEFEQVCAELWGTSERRLP